MPATAPDPKTGERGFTLLELLLAISLLAVILVVIASVLGGHFRTFEYGITDRQNFHEARWAMEAVVELLEEKRGGGLKLLDCGERIQGTSGNSTKNLVSTTNDTNYQIYYDTNELVKDGAIIARHIVVFELATGMTIEVTTGGSASLASGEFIQITIGTGEGRGDPGYYELKTLVVTTF